MVFMQNKVENKVPFYNEVINKKKLQTLLSQIFHNYGTVKSSVILDKIKNLTFYYATRSGISLSTEDLRVPYRKKNLLDLASKEVKSTEQKHSLGVITSVERFQKVIDT